MCHSIPLFYLSFPVNGCCLFFFTSWWSVSVNISIVQLWRHLQDVPPCYEAYDTPEPDSPTAFEDPSLQGSLELKDAQGGRGVLKGILKENKLTLRQIGNQKSLGGIVLYTVNRHDSGSYTDIEVI